MSWLSGAFLHAVDTDGDGLDDAAETNTGVFVSLADTGTDPNDPDSDGDGVGDWYEAAIINVDPGQAQPNGPNDPNDFPAVPYPLPNPNEKVASTTKPVKVYILSGQSNMMGFGQVSGMGTPGTLSTITREEGKFPHLLDGENWTEMDNVQYVGLVGSGGAGKLQPGMGKGNQGSTGLGDHIGPELGFGHIMGFYHDEPVLIIKSGHGNRSLAYSFQPPSGTRFVDGPDTYAGYGDHPRRWTTADPQPFFEDPSDYTNSPDYHFPGGHQFDRCFLDEADWFVDINDPVENRYGMTAVTNVVDILDNFATEYPQWAGQGFEIAGFVWFQ